MMTAALLIEVIGRGEIAIEDHLATLPAVMIGRNCCHAARVTRCMRCNLKFRWHLQQRRRPQGFPSCFSSPDDGHISAHKIGRHPQQLVVLTLGPTVEDPVRLDLVTSLARPGGNLTGINFFSAEVTAKRMELLRELVPGATRVAVLVNPPNISLTETTLKELELAARAMGLQIQVLNASTSREIDAPSQLLRASGPTRSLLASTDF